MASLMTIDFYAYWNGPQVAELFSLVAALTNTADYVTLMKCCAILSLVAAVAMACVRNRGGDIITWFGATILFFMIAFVPRVTVNVVDVRALSARAVENVPIGVGFTAGLSSSVGKWLAEAFETAFTDVDAERFTKFGAAFPERVVAALQKAGPVLPETRALLEPFVEHCVTPEILEDDAKLAEMLRSTNLLSTIGQSGWVNPSRFILSEGKPLYCDRALTAIRTQMTAHEIPAQEKLLMTKLAGSDPGAAGGAGDGLIEAALRKAIPEAQALLLGASQSMSESLAHSLLMTSIPEGVVRAAGRDGSPIAASVALSRSQGNMASEIAFRTMSEIASAFLPKLRNILEFIVIAAFPIVFLLVVATGVAGSVVIRAYFTLYVWLMLWAPLAAVVNYLLIHIDANPMNRLVDQFGGVTMQSADLIRDLGASSQAMAGYVMLLIPVIAFMLARASEMSASSLAANVMSPAGSAAQAQSANLAMGNVASGNASFGNVSSGNVSTSKSDYADAFTSGDVSRSTTPYGTVVRDNSTGSVTAMRVESSNLGLSSQGILSRGEARETASTNGAATVLTEGRSYSSSTGFTSSELSSSASVESEVRSQNASNGIIHNNGMTQSTSESVSYGESISFGRNANVSEGLGYRSQLAISTNTNLSSSETQPNTPTINNAPITLLGHNFTENQNLLSLGSSPINNLQVKGHGPGTDKRTGHQFGHTSGFAGNVSSSVQHSDQSNNSSMSSSVQTDSAHLIDSTIKTLSETSSAGNSKSISSERRSIDSNQSQQNKSDSINKSKSTNLSFANTLRSQNLNSSVISTDMSPSILRNLTDGFSSPEEALEWLSSPENRKAFASSMMTSGTRASAQSSHKAEHLGDGLNSDHNINDINSLPDFAIEQTSPSSSSSSSSKIHDSISAGNTVSPQSVTTPHISDTSYLQHGLLKVTNASFDNEAVSLTGLGSLILPQFLKYESPSERLNELKNLSQSNPDFRRQLIEIGKTKNISNEDILRKLSTK